MSLTSLLRFALRVGNKHVPTHYIQQRALSGAEAVNALRPFYFAVHPDFFGQHPKEREVNENSLKRLNGYLENLQKSGTRFAQPTKLTFYVRETKDNNNDSQQVILPPGFRSVSFTLHSKDVLSTVMDVLKSCSLSIEHMKGLNHNTDTADRPAELANPFYRPIKWDKTYYTFTGFRDPEQELQQAKRVEPILSLWLRNNEPEATKKQSASLPRRDELKRLKKDLCHNLALEDIRWQRSWGVAHRCCQLHSLSRLCLQNPGAMVNLRGRSAIFYPVSDSCLVCSFHRHTIWSAVCLCLEMCLYTVVLTLQNFPGLNVLLENIYSIPLGHTILFADQSGMNASGHVMLGTMDVHYQWTKLFERLPSYQSLHQQTEWLKERISLLLGGVQVIHIERLGPVKPIEEHYGTLNAFHKRLLLRRLAMHPRSMQGLAMTLDNNRSSPSLHEMGHFSIPTSCELSKLQSFLQSQAQEARQRIKHKTQLQAEEEEAVQVCLQKLSLRSLSKEPSISCSQMIPCCRRLLEQRSPLMQGLHLCVSHFYSVMQDGDLCIPWDWKG